MTKKYKSLSHMLRIVVRVNGQLVDIEFNKANLGEGLIGSAYVTNNVDIQKALEKHEYFCRKSSPAFWTDDVEPATPAPVAENPVEETAEEEKKEVKKGRKPKMK